ncbi:MAG: hypothetical protein ACI8UP_002278 [Porticoccaceae bacterium]
MNLWLNKRWALAILIVLMLAVSVVLVLMKYQVSALLENEGDDGLILLSDVSLILDRGRYFLDAKVDIDLPMTIKAGLDNGVPLIFVLKIQFLEPSKYWFDKHLETIEHRFSLTYYELTRHYRVRRLATNTHRNYRSLSSALRGLGAIEGLPLFLNSTSLSLSDSDVISASDSAAVVAILDFRLDSRSLPLPLQPVITSSWRLASKELMWPVN